MIRKYLSILDLYIIKRFLGTFFLSILIIMVVAIIFDIQEKYEDFIKNNAPLYDIIFHYYLNFIPYFANLFSSMFIFISVIFCTSKMAQSSEIIAIHASGISFKRFLRPYMIATALLAILSWVLIMYIIPQSNRVKIAFEDKYVFFKANNWERNIHKQVRPGIFIYLDSYDADNKTCFRFAMSKFEKGKMVSKLNSDYAQWDSTTNRWNVYNYTIRDISVDKHTIRTGMKLDTVFYLTPEDFVIRNVYVDRMTIGELNDFIDEQELQGTDDLNRLLVHKYQRWAYPFSAFILTILGVCLANRKKRGGAVLNIVIGFALTFLYMMFMQVTTTFTIYADLNPLLAVWLPNIFYAIICFFLYKKATI